jgi:predicted dehydrogenase
MTRIERRAFLQSAVLLGASTALSWKRVAGANAAVRVGVIGVGRQGDALVESFRRLEGVRIVVLCDVDRDALAACATKRFDGQVDTCTDLRRVFDRKDVDAVVSATPDHWHALLTIWACQSGKDVYIEKPVSHDVFEGRQMVEAARRYGRIVQGGFQNRSDTGLRSAFEWLAARKLGALRSVRGVLSRARPGIGARSQTPLAPPASVDYDLWLGPAANQPIHRPRFHHDWHWIWNLGAGEIGNHGPHVLDMCRWALGDPPAPKSVQSFGARFAWNDAGETANMQVALFDYGAVPVLVEVNALAAQPDSKERDLVKGIDTGAILTYDRGEFRGDRGGGIAYDLEGQIVREFPGDGGLGHAQNFIDAVRSRRATDLRSPIESAHLSSALTHLANASMRAGRPRSGRALADDLSGDAREVLDRFRGRFAAWHVDDVGTPWSAGARLVLDPETERFSGGTGYQLANGFLKRACRKGFVVPELV